MNIELIPFFLSNCILVLLCGYMLFKLFKLNKRVSSLELSVTADVIGEEPHSIIQSVLETQSKLYHNGVLNGETALREARRLHGLK